MTVSGLRREASKGRLTIEVIAGKQFTTLRAIELMREKCRVMQKEPDCGSNQKNGTAVIISGGRGLECGILRPGDFSVRQSLHKTISKPSAQVLGMIIVPMRPKSGIDGASAYFAQPFQFGGEGIRTFPITIGKCKLDRSVETQWRFRANIPKLNRGQPTRHPLASLLSARK
jgi:hypothetical protein